jgi:uncharacterized Rmd1/YagE family protein
MLVGKDRVEMMNRQMGRLREESQRGIADLNARVDRLDYRVEVMEDTWASMNQKLNSWKTTMTVSLFILSVTSLVLSGIYLGGVLF